MAYPVSATVEPQLADRNRLTTAFRLILAIPHLMLVGGIGVGFVVHSGRSDATSFSGETGVLGTLVLCAWWVTTVIAWFLILVTGKYPQGLYDFGVGAMRWLIRVEAYMLLMVDAYPPFSLI